MATFFGAGVFRPVAGLPAAVRPLAEALPLTPVVAAIRTAYLGRDFANPPARGLPPPVEGLAAFAVQGRGLLLLTAWFVVAAWVVARRLRWEPRRV